MRLGRFLLRSFRKKPREKTSPSFSRKEKLRTKTRVSPTQALTVTPPVPVYVPVDIPKLHSLATQDLLKPGTELKQSIEAFLLDQRSPHTRRAYGKDLKRFVKFLHERNLNRGSESLDRNVLIAYKDFLLSEGLEHTSIDRHLATLRSFFQWLVDDGILQKSPAEGVRFLNPKRISKTLGFSDEEVRKILAQPDLHTRTGSLHYAILMILFYCGLRRSEVCDLRTVNLGEERGHRVLRLQGKGNVERLIPLILPVWNAITHYFLITRRNPRENRSLFLPLRNNRTGNLDKPLDSSAIFYIVTRYAKLAGIANRVSPHSCRATAISNARDHQVPDRAIQEFAGWASPDMITRYDKRKSSVEKSAAHAIDYGKVDPRIPQAPPIQKSEPSSERASAVKSKIEISVPV